MSDTVVADSFAKLLDKVGEPIEAAQKLFEENYDLRKARRDLKEENDALKEKLQKAGVPEGHKVVKDTAVILGDDEVEAWEAYKALGKPDELKTTLDKVPTLEKEIEDGKKKESIASVAQIMGWNAPVLTRLGFDLEYKVEENDKKQKSVSVKDGEKFVPLSDYATSNWPDFLPSLDARGKRRVLDQSPAGGPAPPEGTDKDVDVDQNERLGIMQPM